jgi:response regulator NasT
MSTTPPNGNGAASAPGAADANSDDAVGSRKGTILVVDDDRLVLATLAYGLSQAGYDVIDADNGDDAILLAREHRPQLALLDIRMQGKSGFDVAAYLREYLRMPFMFLSAFADEQTAAQVKELGAVAYLVKPLDIGQILPVVDTAFANLSKPGSTATAIPLADSSSTFATKQGSVAASKPPATPTPAATPAKPARAETQPLPPPELLMAVGVLMQRDSLTRIAAYERLHRLAASEKLSVVDQANRLLDAVESRLPPTPR